MTKNDHYSQIHITFINQDYWISRISQSILTWNFRHTIFHWCGDYGAWKFREVLISIVEVRPFDNVIKFWDEANGFIEGNICIYLLHVKWSNF